MFTERRREDTRYSHKNLETAWYPSRHPIRYVVYGARWAARPVARAPLYRSDIDTHVTHASTEEKSAFTARLPLPASAHPRRHSM